MRHSDRIPEVARLMMVALLIAGCGEDIDPAPGESASDTEGTTAPGLDAGPEETSAASGAADGDSSTTGETADEDEGGAPGADVQCGGQGGAGEDDGVICFYDVESMDMGPAADLEYELVELDGQEAIYIKLVFAPWFVDNTYGSAAVGWDDGHDFDELVGSDHANIVMKDEAGEVVLDFELDYIEDDDSAPSGFRSQGVWEKNGRMNVGEPEAILAANSSLSRNLNERGYAEYVADSPATDAMYTPDPAAPDWDFRVVYEVWVDASLFAQDGGEPFAEACVLSIHASPSKSDDNTLEVVPEECPPGWGCYEEDGCNECDGSYDPDNSDDCDPTEGLPPVP